MLRILGLIAAMLVFALPAPSYAAPSQGKQPAQADANPDADKGKSAALVQQIFDGGIKAYGVGKYDEAQRAFEAAIRAGMPSNQMPRVLYYRGLTFRKLGKPGFAVSDLTSALWLKGGLSEQERADAIKNRALAYNESGISDVPPVPQSAYAEAPPLPGHGTSATQSAAAGSPNTAAAPAAPTSSSSSGGISGFFSNLFGGGSSTESEAPSSTAAIAAPVAESSWGATTEVIPNAAPGQHRPAEIGSPFVTQVASVAAPAPAAQEPITGGSGIRLQVAAVRSRSEADALAGLLVGRHGPELGGRRPEVDEAVIGSMGTFYRVRLGPYASEKEPRQLCNALQSDGFDCLVVTE
ncbi:MAG: SPOR domain-containing protein [Hyphomicrobium sp.]|jgi:hypothetical protein